MRLRPLFTALALVVAGILWEPAWPWSALSAYALAGLCLLGGAAFHRKAALSATLLLAPFFFLALGRTRLAQVPPQLAKEVGRYHILTGELASAPEPTQAGGQRFLLSAGEARILVSAPALPALHLGDMITVRGRLDLPSTATNPGEFDYRAYLKRQGIFLVLSSRGVVPQRQGDSVDAPSWLRTTIHNACFRNLPQGDAALLAGLLISDRSRLPSELNEAFMRTGTVHILSTSGLHLSLLALILFGFLRRLLPRQPLVTVALALGTIALYALAAGGGGAVTRSAVMVGVFLIAPLVRREAEPLHALALAAVLIFLVSPLALFDPGTQLSLATVCTLIVWFKAIERLIWPWEPHLSWRAQVPRWTLLGLSAGGLAQLGSWLLVGLHFNLVSWVAPLANLLIAPLSELLLVLGFLAIAFSAVPLLAPALWGLCGIGLQALKLLALSFASLPFAATSLQSPSVGLVVCWYILLLAPGRAIAFRLRKARFASA